MDNQYIELFGNHQEIGDCSRNANQLANVAFLLTQGNLLVSLSRTPCDPVIQEWGSNFAAGLCQMPNEPSISAIGANLMVAAGCVAWAVSAIAKRAEATSIVDTIHSNLKRNPQNICMYDNYFNAKPDTDPVLKKCYILALNRFSDDELNVFKRYLNR